MFWAFVLFGLLVLPAPIYAQTGDDVSIPSQSLRSESKQAPSTLGAASLTATVQTAILTPTLRRPLESWNAMERRLTLLRIDTDPIQTQNAPTLGWISTKLSTMLHSNYSRRLHSKPNKYTQFLLAGGAVTAASVAWWMWDVLSSPSVVATDTDNTLLVQPILERRAIGFSSMFLF